MLIDRWLLLNTNNVTLRNTQTQAQIYAMHDLQIYVYPKKQETIFVLEESGRTLGRTHNSTQTPNIHNSEWRVRKYCVSSLASAAQRGKHNQIT